MTVDHIHHPDTFLGVAVAAGYRDVGIRLQLNAGDGQPGSQIEVRLDAHQSQQLLTELIHAHRLAWRARRPLDSAPDEIRPRDLLGA